MKQKKVLFLCGVGLAVVGASLALRFAPWSLAQQSPACYIILEDGQTVNLENMCGDESSNENFRQLSAEELYQQGLERHGELELDAAINSFTQAIESDQNNYQYYIGRGESYFSLNNTSAAIADFERALEVFEQQNIDDETMYLFIKGVLEMTET